MFLVESLLAVAVLFFAIRLNVIRDYTIVYFLMLVFFVFSLLPSLGIPYIIDDVDHFHNMARAIQTHTVASWLMAPHNEHVIPLLKAIYLFCYTYFWLNPEIFHLIIIAVCVGIVVLTYKLLFALTRSAPAALIGGSIMAATNLFDGAIFVITNSHILFSLFLFLLLFYAIYQYSLQKKTSWRLTAFSAVLLLPSTFALGLTSIGFAVLFVYLCLPPDLRRDSKDLFPVLCAAWILSLLPYVYAMNAIIHADHYQDLGARSVFEIANFLAPVPFLISHVTGKLIPSIIANPYLAFGLFFVSFFAAGNRAREVAWKRILFFMLFGLSNNFIIYVFRSAWGPAYLDFPRYYVFPAAMLALCYPLALHPFLESKPQFKKMPAVLLVSLLCFFAVTYGSLRRHTNARRAVTETLLMQNFYVNFRKAFVDYFPGSAARKNLHAKNVNILLPAALARYPLRSAQFYAQYILPAPINNRIIWADETDPAFLEYLKAKEYFFLIE
ncbi:MAG: hypothetical protein A2705_01190 [Omnitrophica WOR_2 bacterium RIFCSPHIGHO2_01_FULL_52_10]|nr:MAG: hypothetical protein A2705_01190 [Omnitrophica WOR_2 bacterium RIFCSPHIGHO2_01_FULL_52_10]